MCIFMFSRSKVRRSPLDLPEEGMCDSRVSLLTRITFRSITDLQFWPTASNKSGGHQTTLRRHQTEDSHRFVTEAL